MKSIRIGALEMSNKSRRKLLRTIAAGSGAVIAGKSLPESWSRPVVDSVMLPAHAETTGGAPDEEFFYDETRQYFGSGTQTFPKYQPPIGYRVISITIEFTPAGGRSSAALDNENDSEVQVAVPGGTSGNATVSSTDVSFTPIEVEVIGLSQIIPLPPHDDPDGIDTLTAFEEDSGNDWVKLPAVQSAPTVQTITNPAQIATFLGSGTFNIDYNFSSGIIVITPPTPGVSRQGGFISILASVRITMDPAP